MRAAYADELLNPFSHSAAAFPEVHARARGAVGVVLVAAAAAAGAHAAAAPDAVQSILLPALAASSHLPCRTDTSMRCKASPSMHLLSHCQAVPALESSAA